ncbi:MAG TPA: transglycosylase SLT domain-containing protein [Pyrinomonadaceae bacterium]
MKNIFKHTVSTALLFSIFAPILNVQAQIQTGTSSLRDMPTQVGEQDARVDAVISKAETFFREAEVHLRDRELMKAREKFDKSVETILMSGLPVRSFPKLQKYYAELVERVYRLEVPTQVPQSQIAQATQPTTAAPGETVVSSATETAKTDIPQIGFSEQRFEASPLDELAKLELTPVEQDVTTPEAQQSIASIEQAVERGSLGLKFQVHPMIQQFINYYQARGRSTMEIGLNRSGQFTRMARRIFREEGVPENLVWLGQVESAWKPWARSWAAASGLWQFIPGTGTRYGLRQTAYLDERHNYEKATRASARYLKFLANRYNGNWELAMAGYNSGEGNVDKAIRRAGVANFWAAYQYLPRETRNYVPNILATILVANNPAKYGFTHVRPMPPLIYDKVRVPTATSLNLVAQATDTNVEVLRYLNPDLRQNMTPPEPYVMLVPAGTANQLVATLRRIPANSRNAATLATVVKGEDIQSVANRTGVSVEQLQAMNGGVDLSKTNKVVVPNTSSVERINYVRPRGNTSSAAPSGLMKIKANAGDTITKIASRYGYSAADLARLNGVLPDAPLNAGREIRVPTK